MKKIKLIASLLGCILGVYLTSCFIVGHFNLMKLSGGERCLIVFCTLCTFMVAIGFNLKEH